MEHNILYIGPYNEESHRGRYSLSNIRALIKAGHSLKIVPIYYIDEQFKETPEDLKEFENSSNNIDCDICIQHCDPLQYSFHSGFRKNIGIYTPVGLPDDPIINSRLKMLDNIIVNSLDLKEGLKNIVPKNISDNIRYCPKYIDIAKIKNAHKEKLDWTDPSRYYFYAELTFDDQYDWEKLLYVYITTFMNKRSGLIIKTYGLDNKNKIDYVKNTIESIAIGANIKPDPESMPKVLTGIYSEEDTIKVYNSINCFIDCIRTYDYNDNIFMAAALGKDLICNNKLPSSNFFDSTYRVGANRCNLNIKTHHDIISCTMYSTYYSMDTNSLRDNMLMSYINRSSDLDLHTNELDQYDISHINDILC